MGEGVSDGLVKFKNLVSSCGWAQRENKTQCMVIGVDPLHVTDGSFNSCDISYIMWWHMSC